MIISNVNKISPKKQKLLDDFLSTPIAVGSTVYITDNWLNKTGSPDKVRTCSVTRIVDEKSVEVKESEYGHSDPVVVLIENIGRRNTMEIGENPFLKMRSEVTFVAFTLESILFNLNVLGDKHEDGTGVMKVAGHIVPELNWNPFVIGKDGKKYHYQRPFVWSLNDNQLLLESIYMGIECGRILVRERSWDYVEKNLKKGETEVGFYDLVDGKQRLNAIRGFIMGEYTDMHGNYFADLSYRAQHRFTNHQQFSFATLPSSSTDDDTIEQFLRLNFAGVPQSISHVEFVRSISSKL